jgi:hypothetical protein
MEIVRSLLFGVLFLLVSAAAFAREIPVLTRGDVQLLSLTQLGRNLGQLPSPAAGSVTLRLDSGVLTLFTDSTEALWFARGATEPVEARLSAATRFDGTDWWVALDLISLLGGSISGRTVLLPGQARLLLQQPDTSGSAVAGEQVELARDVTALRLNSGATSVLLVDLGLLGLVHPEQRQELDSFLGELDGERPLYFVVTSSRESAWEAVFGFRQAELQFEARLPWQAVILEGDEQVVTPDQPVSGVILLPAEVNLRSPLEVTWQGRTGRITFRR